MVFKNLLNISLLVASLISFGNLFHRLEVVDALKDLSRYIVLWLFGWLKNEQDSNIDSLTGKYLGIGSPRYSGAVQLSNLILSETGSCTVIWNIQGPSAVGEKEIQHSSAFVLSFVWFLFTYFKVLSHHQIHQFQFPCF